MLYENGAKRRDFPFGARCSGEKNRELQKKFHKRFLIPILHALCKKTGTIPGTFMNMMRFVQLIKQSQRRYGR
jgi:hypothetical protein